MSAEPLTEEMKQALVARFRGELPAKMARERPTLPDPEPADPEEPILCRLPGFTGARSTLGTDGSAPGAGERYSAWAAVAGDGRASFGWYESRDVSSCEAEMQAIRYGLRAYPSGAHVALRLDNSSIIDALRYMIHNRGHTYQYIKGRRNTWGCKDYAIRREVANHMLRLNVTVRYVGDPEGTTDPGRCPADPTMRAAHRLCWAARRCAERGIPPDDPYVYNWLVTYFAPGTGRRVQSLRFSFENFADFYRDLDSSLEVE